MTHRALSRPLRRPLTLFLPFLLAVAGGCQRGESGPLEPDLAVREPWVRAMRIGETGGNSAAYLLLVNRGTAPDRFLGGETPLARAVELHESVLEEGIMRMRPVEGILVLPGDTVELRPGGLHLMLLGLTRSLEEGERISLTLHFQESGSLSVELPVGSGPGPGAG